MSLHNGSKRLGVYCTLVDRIVPGYPRDTINEILEKVQLEDKMVVKAEIFHLWVIEAPESVAKGISC